MFRLKVCGVTRVEDAQLCCEAGVDAIGLNFCEGSPRRVDPAVAQQIVQASQGKLELVGVFANLPGVEIRALALDLGLDFVQLHGGESPEVLAELSGLKVIKAIRVRPGGLAEFCKTAHAWLAYDATPISALLVDAWVPGQLGGTGRPLESVLAREARDETSPETSVVNTSQRPEK